MKDFRKPPTGTVKRMCQLGEESLPLFAIPVSTLSLNLVQKKSSIATAQKMVTAKMTNREAQNGTCKDSLRVLYLK